MMGQTMKLGKKLYITGKGRCNLTNACLWDDFFDNVMHNSRFMYSAFSAFDNYNLMDLVEAAGCPLKTERGNRVFPTSDKSSDVIKALERALREAGVEVRRHAAVDSVETHQIDGVTTVTGITLKDGTQMGCDKVIMATGGLTYTSTGSDGYGMAMAQKMGHHIAACRPSLVGLRTVEKWPQELQGLSLRNVALTLKKKGKKVAAEQGEMLFTHFGVSGPMVLTHSARLDDAPGDYELSIDLKPGMTEEQVQNRLRRDFELYCNKQLINALGDLMPAKLIPVFVALSKIPPDKRINQISKVERRTLEILLKDLPLHVADYYSMNSAIITAGGVDVGEINPKTMESKRIDGLFFAGEMIDVDALTGGFNIQIAASTGWLAGMHH